MRKIKLSAIIILAVVLLVGCSSSSKEDEVVLKYWAAPLAADHVLKETWEEVFDEFYEETGIKVEMEVVPNSDINTRLTNAMTSGIGPDVTGMGNNSSVVFSAAGGLLPLTQERLDKIGGQDKFVESMFTVTGEQGKDPVSVPLNGGVSILFYNKDLFEARGIDGVPEKWEDFIAVAQSLTEDTDGDGRPDKWGFGFHGQPTQNWKSILYLMFQHGGEYLNDDGSISFNQDETIDAVTMLGELVSKYQISPPAVAEWTADEAMAAFANGDIAMVISDVENNSKLDNSDVNFGVAKMPYILPGQTDGRDVTSHVGGTNVGILKSTKHEEEALMFLEFITRPEINKKLNDSFGTYSSIKDVYDESELSDMQKVALDILTNRAQPMPRVPYFLPSLYEITGGVQDVLYRSSQEEVSREFVKDMLDQATETINSTIVSD